MVVILYTATLSALSISFQSHFKLDFKHFNPCGESDQLVVNLNLAKKG